ncbi:glucan endo-1,3-beta-glucosidase-like [Rutidosis leptorrhynchoides]|uniref:glucan endo-1,3-beta-glucosidase-like n=1 Tax=Rutidosis leptorrhynchoides TaxID=125765 RepID=UPI003A99AE90
MGPRKHCPIRISINFRCISVGNGIEGVNLKVYAIGAIENLHKALQSSGYKIPVTTTVGNYLLRDSDPPSIGDFSAEVKPPMKQMLNFLTSNGYPLLVMMYPYFKYVRDPSKIPLSYALTNSTEVIVRDGNLEYKNLFDAMTDAMYSALEKVSEEGSESVEVVICETGWPTAGDWGFESIELAQTYNQNLVKHVLSKDSQLGKLYKNALNFNQIPIVAGHDLDINY